MRKQFYTNHASYLNRGFLGCKLQHYKALSGIREHCPNQTQNYKKNFSVKINTEAFCSCEG